MGHIFGGAWTEVKLDVITDYLEYYNIVLRNQPSPDRPFKRWYIDAFAGSGSRTATVARGGLFEAGPLHVEEIELAGSARRALTISPPFDHLCFIEGHLGRFKGLQKLQGEFPESDILCRRGDANEQLQQLFSSPPWSTQQEGRGKHRAVLFLDPYGLSVKWQTLKLLANTRAVDVWYLFPLEGVSRQLAHDFDKIDANKQLSLDQIFGTPNWRRDLYETEVAATLFDMLEQRTGRTVTKAQIQAYAISRFKTIFSYVSQPLPLVNEAERQLFSLICLANPLTDKAAGLISNGVEWVLKRAATASRRTPSL